mmetsp:Transcript_49565/g.124622  ORF Transcript_49565/g.124622 Transcript_49565/m.124622 type:complete len:201 (+) Transcript_49565:363-965(+)
MADENEDGDGKVKVLVLGAGGVGKSALTIQFVSGQFQEFYDPTIEELYRKSVQVDGQTYELEIIDTAGTEQFKAMRDLYMKDGQAFILVYSITSLGTFNELDEIKTQIMRIQDDEDVPMVLVGNKFDLQDKREVNRDDVNQWKGSFKNKYLKCFEASAKTNYNVQSIFHEAVHLAISKNPNLNKQQSSGRKAQGCKCVLC